MEPKTNLPGVNPSDPATGAEVRPPEVLALLNTVAKLLEEGLPAKALDVIARAKIRSPWVTHAAGVCQLRLGNAKVAVDAFRGLVLAAGGLLLRAEVPIVFKTNYATALLATDNLAGCLSVLGEIREEAHPAVPQLRVALRRWKESLTFWQKVQWYLGGQPARPVTLGFPLGDLE